MRKTNDSTDSNPMWVKGHAAGSVVGNADRGGGCHGPGGTLGAGEVLQLDWEVGTRCAHMELHRPMDCP